MITTSMTSANTSGYGNVIQDIVDESFVNALSQNSVDLQKRKEALAKYLLVSNIPGRKPADLDREIVKKWNAAVSGCGDEYHGQLKVYEAPLLFQYRDADGKSWCLDVYDILATAEQKRGWFSTNTVFKNPINGEPLSDQHVAKLGWHMDMLAAIYQSSPTSLQQLQDTIEAKLASKDPKLIPIAKEIAQKVAIAYVWISLSGVAPVTALAVGTLFNRHLKLTSYYRQIIEDLVKGTMLKNAQRPRSKVSAQLLEIIGKGPSKAVVSDIYIPANANELLSLEDTAELIKVAPKKIDDTDASINISNADNVDNVISAPSAPPNPMLYQNPTFPECARAFPQLLKQRPHRRPKSRRRVRSRCER